MTSAGRRALEEWAKIAAAHVAEGIRIGHIGSTTVQPGSKPIIDVLVTVVDVQDEPRYLPAVQGAGYVLRVLEPGHRMLPLDCVQ